VGGYSTIILIFYYKNSLNSIIIGYKDIGKERQLYQYFTVIIVVSKNDF